MIKAFIFDLDGTLYETKAMDEANKLALTKSVASHFGIADVEASQRLLDQAFRRSNSSERGSLLGAAQDLGVSLASITNNQSRYVQPERLIRKDDEVSIAIIELSKSYKIALLTNTRTSIAVRAVEAIGIPSEIFDEVRGGDKLSSPKPSKLDILDMCRKMKINPSETISVGDRWSVDLEPAVEAGLMVRKVRGRNELVQWLREEFLSAPPHLLA